MAKQINLDLLQAELKERNISYHMISRRIGVSVSMLSLVFRGKRNMTLVTLNKILDKMNINIANIME